MAHATPVISDVFLSPRPSALARLGLVVAGIALLVLAAKVKVPMWPVPMTMQTFAVLTIGAAYGPSLGLLTVVGYLALGAIGLNVFAGDGSALGLAYMLGGTGGYLVGFVLAAALVGLLARRGWDRSVPGMAAALLIANACIYIPGLLWLGALHGWDKPILEWGLWPFLPGDVLKLALAALVIPGLWNLLRRAGFTSSHR